MSAYGKLLEVFAGPVKEGEEKHFHFQNMDVFNKVLEILGVNKLEVSGMRITALSVERKDGVRIAHIVGTPLVDTGQDSVRVAAGPFELT